MDEHDIKTILKAHPPKDAFRYSKHVKRCIDAAFVACEKKWRDCEACEYGWDANHHTEHCDPVLVRRMFLLVCSLLSIPGGVYHGFHHLVWIKANLLTYHKYNSPMREKDAETMSVPVELAIEHLLHNENQGKTILCDFTNVGPYRCVDLPSYYNAAEARRVLSAAWRTHECDCDYRVVGSDGAMSEYQCWHLHNLPLMETLNKHAYLEIAKNVWLATERILPSELVEEVFEYALLCEEIPDRCDVRDNDGKAYREYKFCDSLGWQDRPDEECRYKL